MVDNERWVLYISCFCDGLTELFVELKLLIGVYLVQDVDVGRWVLQRKSC